MNCSKQLLVLTSTYWLGQFWSEFDMKVSLESAETFWGKVTENNNNY